MAREGSASLRLLFASWHCYFDTSSGAAVATRALLELLAKSGWTARVLCGPVIDFGARESLAQLLADQQVTLERKSFESEAPPFCVYQCRSRGAAAAVYEPRDYHSGAASQRQAHQFLALLERTLARLRPDVLLTYGGDRLAAETISLARRRGAAVVFWLRNFAYHDARLFAGVDGIIVPSQYCAEIYGQRLGLRCTPLPSPIDWLRIRCASSEFKPLGAHVVRPQPARAERRYVTFVNPALNKGALVFYRIVEQLNECRPDIPLLMVEGRGGFGWMARAGVDLRRFSNLHHMANTPDPRDFYSVSRIVLMLSLCDESFGRVVAEAQINGIPVLASDRGALPEVVADGGLVLPIPRRYRPETLKVPTADEVSPWVAAIVRLWDDDVYYEQIRQRALHAAERWRSDRIAGEHDAFFRKLLGRVSS